MWRCFILTQLNIDTEAYIGGQYKSINEYISSFVKKNQADARSYIEHNVDLLDTDLVKFFDDCPATLFMDVVTELKLAGVDCSEAVKKHMLNSIERAIKSGDIYLRELDTNTCNTSQEVTE